MTIIVIAKKCETFLWQSQTRKGLLRHEVPRNDVCKKKAFTLAVDISLDYYETV